MLGGRFFGPRCRIPKPADNFVVSSSIVRYLRNCRLRSRMFFVASCRPRLVIRWRWATWRPSSVGRYVFLPATGVCTLQWIYYWRIVTPEHENSKQIIFYAFENRKVSPFPKTTDPRIHCIYRYLQCITVFGRVHATANPISNCKENSLHRDADTTHTYYLLLAVLLEKCGIFYPFSFNQNKQLAWVYLLTVSTAH